MCHLSLKEYIFLIISPFHPKNSPNPPQQNAIHTQTNSTNHRSHTQRESSLQFTKRNRNRQHGNHSPLVLKQFLRLPAAHKGIVWIVLGDCPNRLFEFNQLPRARCRITEPSLRLHRALAWIATKARQFSAIKQTIQHNQRREPASSKDCASTFKLSK